MKTKTTVAALCLATLGTICVAILLARQPHTSEATAAGAAAEQAFEVKGQIRSLEADGTTVHIEHEEIPGYMPSMTMPFTVKDPTELRGLQAGDAVKFRLVVTQDDSWIADLAKLDQAPADLAKPAPAAPAEASAADPVAIGSPVPDFTLTDQNGAPVHLRDYRGQAVLVTFIYTRCPLPNYCPLMSMNFASLQARLSQEFPGKFHLLSVSFDPAFDTPQVLKDYAARYNRDEKTWTFACGTPAQVDRVAGLFGLLYKPEGGVITHDLRTALISPEGRLVHIWRSNVWTPFEVQRRVRETMIPAQQARL